MNKNDFENVPEFGFEINHFLKKKENWFIIIIIISKV